jgi:hypothetical protein
VTQECLVTPLIPLYLAAVFALPLGHVARALAALAAAPLFVLLGMARLLVLALPPVLVASPVFLVHAFFQLLLAAVLVIGAALWREGRAARAWPRASARALGGAAAAVALAALVGAPYGRGIGAAARSLAAGLGAAGEGPSDPQGALAILPTFQVAFLVALWVAALAPARGRGLLAALGALALGQVALLAALHAGLGVEPPVAAVRGFAVGAPSLLLLPLVRPPAKRPRAVARETHAFRAP